MPNEQKAVAIQAASSSIFDTLKSQLTKGNVAGIADIFNIGEASADSPVVQRQVQIKPINFRLLVLMQKRQKVLALLLYQ